MRYNKRHGFLKVHIKVIKATSLTKRDAGWCKALWKSKNYHFWSRKAEI